MNKKQIHVISIWNCKSKINNEKIMKIQQLKTTGRITCDHNFSPRNEREVNFLAAIETASRFLSKMLDVSVVLTVERQASWRGISVIQHSIWIKKRMEYRFLGSGIS